MKVLFNIRFQNQPVEVWLDKAMVELLVLRLKNCETPRTCHFAVQRWLSLAARQHFGHLAVPQEQVQQWLKSFLRKAINR